MRWTSQPPDPLHFWIRFAPRPWPGWDGLWVDLAQSVLGNSSTSSLEIPERWRTDPPDDVVYLPPVPIELEGARQDLASFFTEHGTPVLLQQPVETVQVSGGSASVFDVLEALLAGRQAALADLPADSKVVWPLIAGLTDERRLWDEGLAALATAGAGYVQPLALELAPGDKRLLVDRAGEQSFHAVFHGQHPSERQFSSLAVDHGFSPFLPRPLPTASVKRENRRLAEQLALTAELWLRLGRAESAGQSLYRSARWVDRESYDLTMLCREGNLGVFPWLDTLSSGVISEFVSSGSSGLLAELEAEYLAAPG
jgi:hypothetical protein